MSQEFNADSVPDTTHHHFHADNEPLRTTADRTTDYSVQALDGTGTALPEQKGVSGKVEEGKDRVMGVGKHEHRDDTTTAPTSSTRTDDSDATRAPTDTSDKPTKVSIGDKVIGKAQEVVGKVAHKPAMQEKGELRRTEGVTGATRDV